MTENLIGRSKINKPVHPWLKKINIHYVPGPATSLIESFVDGILDEFEHLGHKVQTSPDADTDLVITTVSYGEVLNWRKALMFTGRIHLKLDHTPVALSIIQMTPQQFDEAISNLEEALAKDPPDENDFIYAGLAPKAPRVLIEQGLRGGAILSLLRVLQAQSKCIRILLVVGDDKLERVYHFDLVGAHPFSDLSDGEANFYEDIVLRTVTYESTFDVTEHEVVGDIVPLDQWKSLTTIVGMQRAGEELGVRNFFTEMLRINDLSTVPAINDSIASQYSEGCYTTWDPKLQALITTVTGSARPVDKGDIGEDDLAVIVGVRPDGLGALVRHVEGKQNDAPSSEAVELMDMDYPLPRIMLGVEWEDQVRVPVVRSKLHGHRSVRAYDPTLVEYVPMDTPYFHYLVSCATEAQARGIKSAFSRAKSLLDPTDPRVAAFTILPGHGLVITEKWVAGNDPLQIIWEFIDDGTIEIDKLVPQGELNYKQGEDGRMYIEGL